jgi:hypothetical protein
MSHLCPAIHQISSSFYSTAYSTCLPFAGAKSQYFPFLADREIGAVTPNDILTFLTAFTEGQQQSTKRFKYTILKSLLNLFWNSWPGAV